LKEKILSKFREELEKNDEEEVQNEEMLNEMFEE